MEKLEGDCARNTIKIKRYERRPEEQFDDLPDDWDLYEDMESLKRRNCFMCTGKVTLGGLDINKSTT